MAGAGSLVVSLGLDAVAYIQGWTKVEQQTQKAVEATKAQVAAIDRQIKGFEKQVAMLGMSTREQKLYELALKGATQAQLAQANSALRHVETFGRLQKAASLAGAAIGISFVALPAILAAAFSKIVKGVDDLNDLADATGSTIENISALEDVALRTGGSFDTVSTALIKFNKVLHDAEAGKETANILKAIGLNFEELRRLDPAEAMRRTAVAFAQFADDGSKGRAFIQLFSKSVSDLAPYMNDLSKQTELAGTVMTKQAKEAEEFSHRLSALKKDVIDLARSLAGPLVEAVNAANAAMKAAQAEGAGFLARIAAGQRSMLSSLTGGALGGEPKDYAADEQKRIKELNSLLADGNLTLQLKLGVTKQIADLEAKQLARNLSGFAKTASSFGGGGKQSLGDIGGDPPPPKKVGGGVGRQVSEAQRYLESLEQQLEKTQQLTAVEQVLADIREKRIKGGLSAAQQQEALQTAGLIDAKKVLTELLKSEQQARESVSKMVQAANEAAATETAQLISGNDALRLEIELIGAEVTARAAIENARLGSIITLKEEQLAMLQNADAVGVATRELEAQIVVLKERQRLTSKKANAEMFMDQAKKIDDTANHADKTMAESIANGILEGYRKGNSYAEIFLTELKAQFAKTILAPRIEPIVKAGNSLIEQILSGILGSFGGGSSYAGGMGNGSWGESEAYGMAGGGPVSAGGMYRVNERRTESLKLNGEQFLLMGAQGGNVDSNPRMGGAGVTVNQVLNVGQGVSRNELAAAMVQAKEQAKAEIMRSMRSSNGSFAT